MRGRGKNDDGYTTKGEEGKDEGHEESGKQKGKNIWRGKEESEYGRRKKGTERNKKD